jgi:hypothetical protein
MPAVASVLSVVSAVGSLLTAWRLYASGLGLKYRVFVAFLVFWALCAAGQLFLSRDPDAYQKFWVVTQAVSLVLYVWVVIEFMGLILFRHRGFYTAGRWAMVAGILVSVLISAAALIPKITAEMPQRTRILGYSYAAERAVDFSLAIFLLLMLSLLNFYAVPLSRNVLVHAVVYTIFFISSSLAMFLWTLFGLKHLETVNLVTMTVNCVCMLAWLLLLSPEGEEARVKAPWYDPEQEQRILAHLDSLNATLLKIARK